MHHGAEHINAEWQQPAAAAAAAAKVQGLGKRHSSITSSASLPVCGLAYPCRVQRCLSSTQPQQLRLCLHILLPAATAAVLMCCQVCQSQMGVVMGDLALGCGLYSADFVEQLVLCFLWSMAFFRAVLIVEWLNFVTVSWQHQCVVVVCGSCRPKLVVLAAAAYWTCYAAMPTRVVQIH